MALDRIWKFPLQPAERQRISTPSEMAFLSLGKDGAGEICIWAAVDTKSANRMTEIVIVGTGKPLPYVGTYLGTVMDGPFVWHVFTGPGDAMRRASEFHYLTKDNG